MFVLPTEVFGRVAINLQGKFLLSRHFTRFNKLLIYSISKWDPPIVEIIINEKYLFSAIASGLEVGSDVIYFVPSKSWFSEYIPLQQKTFSFELVYIYISVQRVPSYIGDSVSSPSEQKFNSDEEFKYIDDCCQYEWMNENK